MLTQEEVETALSAGYEGRGFETKGPGLRGDRAFFVKVARAALSMGNLRDGGHVVIGINHHRDWNQSSWRIVKRHPHDERHFWRGELQ